MIWIKLINFTDTKFIMSADMPDSVKQKRPNNCPCLLSRVSYYICRTLAIDGCCYPSTVVNHS